MKGAADGLEQTALALLRRRFGLALVGNSGQGKPTLNPEHPDGHDRTEHGQAGNRPSGDVDRTIRFRSIDHRIVPMGHNSLLEVASVGRSPAAAQGSNTLY